MALSILNNIPSLAAENALNTTNSALQTTLYRLSTGSRINSGADDAAGLAIANGLEANITALTQSARNANDGVGALQVADGSLAQVTNLLNRAVTLATEASTGTVSDSQRTALDAEFTQIKAEIDQIGNTTTYNGTSVFTGGSTNVFLSDANSSSTISVTTGTLSASGIGLGAAASNTLSAIGNVSDGDTVTIGTQTYTFKTTLTGAANEVLIGGSASDSLANLANAINGGPGAGVAYGTGTTANTSASALAGTSTITLTALTTGTDGNSIVSTETAANLGFSNGATFTGGSGSAGLTTAAAAQSALGAINSAIATVAGLRGTIGAAINRLQAASSVISNQTQNLTSAEDGITAADIPSEVANLTKYQVLNQTGIAALAQANATQQSVLRLLQ